MKSLNILPAAVMAAAASVALVSCQDEISTIGDSLFDQSVSVFIDSAAYNLNGVSVETPFIDARTSTNMIGNISVPEYGSLSAEYVARLMCASEMSIPDSITAAHVDSMTMVIEVPRNSIVGDSLAPQKVAVYQLTKPIPNDIRSSFNPDGYYDPASPLAVTNYTLSGLNLSDSAFRAAKIIPVSLTLPKEWAVRTFEAYRRDPSVFQWPETFEKYMNGIYVKPTFGRGCIAAVQITRFNTYWHYTVMRTEVIDSVSVKVPKLMKDSICLFATAPEVLSTNLLSYKPSDRIRQLVGEGKHIITTPTGYNVRFTFPGRRLIEEYLASQKDLSTINNLAFGIPAADIRNDYGISVAPSLLMVRTSEMESFFAEAKVPDNKIAFLADYSSADGRYYFNQMREFVVDLNRQYGKIPEADFDELNEFTLVPVNVSKEQVQNADGTYTTYITGVSPYQVKPTMTQLDLKNTLVVFTYTSQNL